MTRWLAICWLGEVDALTGDYGNARRRYEEVLQKGVASDGDLARHTAVLDLGALLLALGEVSAAAGVIQPAVSDFQNEVPLMRIPFLVVHGQLLLASGDEAGARAEFETARGAAEQMENAPLTAQIDHNLGLLALRQGELNEAEDLIHRALAASPAGKRTRRHRRAGGSRGDRHPPGERRRGRAALRCRRHDPCFHRSRSEAG